MGIFGGWGDQAKAAGEGVEKVGGALDSLFTSDEERLTHKEVMTRLKEKKFEVMGKMSLIEAASRSSFVAGWRPFIGWVAGISLFFYFVPQYIMGAYIFIDTYLDTGKLIDYPVEPTAVLELVGALLGLGALRTIEKVSGAAK